MRRLRQKIEADPDHPKHLLTVRGVGYRLVASPSAPRTDASPATAAPNHDEAPAAPARTSDGTPAAPAPAPERDRP
jgi:DNA-binding winged helix-turn-helix (wHTH) protein